MRRDLAIILPVMAGLSALAAPAAHAAPFTPAPNASFVLDLDTRNGAFSEWRADDLTNLNALRAKLTVARLGDDPQWSPVFTITLKNQDSEARFQISAVKGLLLPTAQSSAAGKDIQRDLFLAPPTVGETFGLDVDWNADGTASIVIHTKAADGLNGFERHDVKLSGPPTQIEITDSTGEMTLDPLQLGRTAP